MLCQTLPSPPCYLRSSYLHACSSSPEPPGLRYYILTSTTLNATFPRDMGHMEPWPEGVDSSLLMEGGGEYRRIACLLQTRLTATEAYCSRQEVPFSQPRSPKAVHVTRHCSASASQRERVAERVCVGPSRNILCTRKTQSRIDKVRAVSMWRPSLHLLFFFLNKRYSRIKTRPERGEDRHLLPDHLVFTLSRTVAAA
ncbi:hypothetical protein BD289DRAFT_151543 [Coniella lustricola]|uniref:Uncharacterized protein n=1 Tax=Coniella lustricola TaxID=2025994 RepID=A0A2T2ZUR7_9PEZI|nr:hypothetical protein BD289DRAFT_151543 [Coniella lustricola]